MGHDYPAGTPECQERTSSFFTLSDQLAMVASVPVDPSVPLWRRVRAASSTQNRRELLTVVAVVLLWVLGRLVMLKVFSNPSSNYITGDVNYYRAWLTGGHTDKEMLIEYPVPVLWFMRVLTWFSVGEQVQYFNQLFVVIMLVLDAVMAMALWRNGKRWGAVWWSIFVPALGPIMWFRFDMVPAVCMGLAALWHKRHPLACGAMIACGAALKLWPALLIVPMLGRSRQAIRRLVSFLVVGFGLGLSSLLLTGWQRTTSPLTWQSDRGLQIESVQSTIPMIRRLADDTGAFHVGMSRFNAFEITGPGVGFWQTLSSLLMVLTLAGTILLGVLAWRRNGFSHRTAVLSAIVIVGAMILANKTLSPQYMIWWAAPMAAILDDFLPDPDRDVQPGGAIETLALVTAATLVLIALLTQAVYPLMYGQIIGDDPTSEATATLVARNLLIVLALLTSVGALVLSLRQDGNADTVAQDDGHPTPPGPSQDVRPPERTSSSTPLDDPDPAGMTTAERSTEKSASAPLVRPEHHSDVSRRTSRFARRTTAQEATTSARHAASGSSSMTLPEPRTETLWMRTTHRYGNASPRATNGTMLITSGTIAAPKRSSSDQPQNLSSSSRPAHLESSAPRRRISNVAVSRTADEANVPRRAAGAAR